jgi:hypothetical protein
MNRDLSLQELYNLSQVSKDEVRRFNGKTEQEIYIDLRD